MTCGLSSLRALLLLLFTYAALAPRVWKRERRSFVEPSRAPGQYQDSLCLCVFVLAPTSHNTGLFFFDLSVSLRSALYSFGKTPKDGIFFVFAKGLRAQRAGRVAPRRGGAKRRAAALGAAQRRKAPPQAAERRAAHKVCFSAFNFPPIIEKQNSQKMLTGTSAGIVFGQICGLENL